MEITQGSPFSDRIDSSSDEEPELRIPVATIHRRSHVAASGLGISAKEYRGMKRMGVPSIFFELLHFAFLIQGWVSMDTDLVDWFAGAEVIRAAGDHSNLVSRSFEVLHDPILEDFLGLDGYLNALRFAKALRILGFSHWGIVCSSFVWQVRNVTKRSARRPMDNQHVLLTRLGNALASRMVLIICLTSQKQVLDVVEQPLSSLLGEHTRVKKLHFQHVSTWMGLFGAETPKPTRLYSRYIGALLPLKRRMSASAKRGFAKLTYTYTNIHNEIKTQSLKRNMKRSQEYPKDYAKSAVKSYMTWRNQQHIQNPECESDSDYDDLGPASWPEALLEPMLHKLAKRHPRSKSHF